MAIEVADEHNPIEVVRALLDALADVLADSRRGWVISEEVGVMVSKSDDYGGRVVLELRIRAEP